MDAAAIMIPVFLPFPQHQWTGHPLIDNAKAMLPLPLYPHNPKEMYLPLTALSKKEKGGPSSRKHLKADDGMPV